MRFLRPDLLRWWLVIPVIVASWAIHWRVVREWRLRSPVAARFAPLSRRSSGRRQVARLLASVATAGALVFALMRPQILLVRRVPDYERQDLIVMLDRSVSMRARDVAPSRFARATLELRNFLRQKPDGIGRVGLVGFADSSVVLSYLTADVESILFYLDWLDGPSASASAMFGTNIGAALGSGRADSPDGWKNRRCVSARRLRATGDDQVRGGHAAGYRGSHRRPVRAIDVRHRARPCTRRHRPRRPPAARMARKPRVP